MTHEKPHSSPVNAELLELVRQLDLLASGQSLKPSRIREVAFRLIGIQEDLPDVEHRNTLGEAAHYLRLFAKAEAPAILPQRMPVSMTELAKVIYDAGARGTNGVAEAILKAYHVSRHPRKQNPMSDTAETLLREHLKLCSEAYIHGLVPTKEAHWAGGDGEYTLCNRWYFDSDLRRRTAAFLNRK